MKKIVKICLIIAVIAAALGVVGIGAGMAMGASPDEFLNISLNETHRVFKRGEQTGAAEHHAEKEPKPIEENGSAAAEKSAAEKPATQAKPVPEGLSLGDKNTQGLEFDLKAGEISFYLHDGDQILLAGENLNEISRHLEIENEENEISVEDTRARVEGNWKLQVYLPNRNFRDIDLDLGAADVYIEALQADEIAIDLGAGNLEADRIAAGRSADLDVGAGAMKVAYLEGKALDLDCGMGSMDIALQGRKTEYHSTLSCGIGKIQLGADSFSGLGRETVVGTALASEAGKFLEADCGVGEMIITFEEE